MYPGFESVSPEAETSLLDWMLQFACRRKAPGGTLAIGAPEMGRKDKRPWAPVRRRFNAKKLSAQKNGTLVLISDPFKLVMGWAGESPAPPTHRYVSVFVEP